MRFKRFLRDEWRLATIVLASLAIVGCGSLQQDALKQKVQNQKTSAIEGLDVTKFKQGAFVKTPEIVDCVTGSGTKTSCYKLTTSGGPAGREPGYFCPRTISDGAAISGAWFSKDGRGDLVALTGQFIANLATYYNDPNWKLFDPATGKVRFTATKEACLGAARPDVEEQYKQNCIECKLAYLSKDFSRTYLIPTKPIVAAQSERARTVGIALDGAELSGSAPIDAILGSYTIAAFDDCGGHINEHQGYHYHAATGCTNAPVSSDGYAALVGYASDGYAIYAMKDAAGQEAETLDECRGRSDAVRGYHYRAASPSENMMIGCLHGETVRPAGEPGDGPRPPPNGPNDTPPPGRGKMPDMPSKK